MTGQGCLKTTTQSCAVNSRHNQFGRVFQRAKHGWQRWITRWFAEFGNIRTSDKCTSLTHQNDRVGVVFLRGVNGIQDAFADCLRQGVDGRAVYLDDADVIDDFVADYTRHSKFLVSE